MENWTPKKELNLGIYLGCIMGFSARSQFLDFSQLLLHVMEAKLDIELFAMIVWTIWLKRNKIISTPQPSLLTWLSKEPMNLCQSTRQLNHSLNLFIPDLVPRGLILQLIATKLNLIELLLKMNIDLELGLSLEMTKVWRLLPSPRISLPHFIQELEALVASRA